MNKLKLTPDQITDLVEASVDKAFPIFRHYGWTYYNTVGDISRSELLEELRPLVEQFNNSNSLDEIGCGRFLVSAAGETGIRVSLDLAMAWPNE